MDSKKVRCAGCGTELDLVLVDGGQRSVESLRERSLRAELALSEGAHAEALQRRATCVSCEQKAELVLDEELAQLERQCAAMEKHNRELAETVQNASKPRDEDALALEMRQLDTQLLLLREKKAQQRQLDEEVTHEVNILRSQNELLRERRAQMYNSMLHAEHRASFAAEQLHMQLAHLGSIQRQMDELLTFGVYRALFQLDHEASVPAVNSFRLGMNAQQRTTCEEINAAIGQLALLLHVLSKQLRYFSAQIALLPFGNRSEIESDRGLFPLYARHDFTFAEKSWRSVIPFIGNHPQDLVDFDNGLSQLLRYTEGLLEHAAQMYKERLQLHYVIEGDTLRHVDGHPYSISVRQANGEQWSTAIRYLLHNLDQVLLLLDSDERERCYELAKQLTPK